MRLDEQIARLMAKLPRLLMNLIRRSKPFLVQISMPRQGRLKISWSYTMSEMDLVQGEDVEMDLLMEEEDVMGENT